MKKLFLLVGATLLTLSINAQTATYQEVKLDYNGTSSYQGSVRWSGLQLGNNGQNRIVAGRTSVNGWLDFYVNNTNDAADYSVTPDGLLAMRIQANGRIGLGTSNPAELLDVNGNINWTGYKSGNPRALNIGYSGGNYGGIGYNIDFTGTTGQFNRPLSDRSSYLQFTSGGFSFYGTANSSAANNIDLTGGGTNLSLFAMFDNTGNFGIGTANPTEKLSVNGTIRSKEVKVETANWPDYVFEKGYKVEKLEELESYIKANKHLPGIPSAKEVEKEGISLGEMNAKLLQKIEEMTLQMIEINKQMKEQGEKIREQGTKIRELEVSEKKRK